MGYSQDNFPTRKECYEARDVSRRVPTLLGVYLAYLLFFTLAPFTAAVDSSLSLTQLYDQKFEGLDGFSGVSLWDIVTNILLFIPYGFLVVSLPAVSASPWWIKVLLASVSAGLLSFTIEVCQLFLPRAPSVVDVSFNAVGGIAGGLVGSVRGGAVIRLMRQGWTPFRSRTSLALLIAGYLLTLFASFSLPLPLAPDFSNWDPHYPFQLGNEASLGRPWLGEIYLVALYDRALNRGEVWSNFTAGPFNPAAHKRIGEGVIALYDFTEGSGDLVHDRAVSGTPLNLRIRDPRHVRWLTPRGIAIREGTIMTSSGSPTKLSTGRLSSRNELSVEAWVVPANLSQRGPARIVSYSKDPQQRNFTLDQQERDLVFRLRTPISGSNGTNPELRTRDQPLSLALQHLVATYQNRRETLYLNGTEHGIAFLRAKITLSDRVLDLLGYELKWPMWSLSVFTLGVLLYIFLKRQMRRSQHVACVSVITALATLALLVGIRMMMLKSAVEPSFVLVTVSTALLSVLVAVRVNRSIQLS